MDSQLPPSNSSTISESDGVTYQAIHRGRDSISTVNSEGRRRPSEKYTKEEPVATSTGVNVARAEAEFAELNKELSRTSNLERRLSRTQSRQSRKNQVAADVEKGRPESDISSDEPFDLEAVLRGNRDEEEAAGIKSKRIGVVWDGLTVSGIGGVKNYVKVSTPPAQFHVVVVLMSAPCLACCSRS